MLSFDFVDVFKNARTKAEEAHNVQSVIDTLSLDIINTSLSHLRSHSFLAPILFDHNTRTHYRLFWLVSVARVLSVEMSQQSDLFSRFFCGLPSWFSKSRKVKRHALQRVLQMSSPTVYFYHHHYCDVTGTSVFSGQDLWHNRPGPRHTRTHRQRPLSRAQQNKQTNTVSWTKRNLWPPFLLHYMLNCVWLVLGLETKIIPRVWTAPTNWLLWEKQLCLRGKLYFLRSAMES